MQFHPGVLDRNKTWVCYLKPQVYLGDKITWHSSFSDFFFLYFPHSPLYDSLFLLLQTAAVVAFNCI